MNLLTEPVFRVETPNGRERLSLPQLLAALGLDRVESLPGLQRHQEDAFHIFLCYLAGAVLARESQTDPCQSAEFWLEGIRRLTGREDDCAWTLVVEDVTLPAFMQAPVPKDELFEKKFSIIKTSSDALDVLPTSKNHDLKSSRAFDAEMDDWVFALISFQTMSGYTAKHQGISRMSSGYGSRPYVSLAYNYRLGQQWYRDISKILSVRRELLSGPWHYKNDGAVFTWIQEWDTKSSLSITQLDPFFIEISRTVRLCNLDGKTVARTAMEIAPRINAKDLNGILGDPWTPINLNDKKKGQSALTVSSNGLTPELLRNLIFEDGYKPAAMQLHDAGREGQACQFTASVLVRGQGTTDGFHQAALPIPGKTGSRLFRRGPDRDRLATLSKTAINDAGQMQNQVLKVALFSFLEGGQNIDKIDREKHGIKEWWKTTENQFSEAWSRDYFPWLWRMGEQEDDDAARLEWLKALRDNAETVLDDAINRYPTHSGRFYRSQVKAKSVFFSCLYSEHNFPQLKEADHGNAHTD
jgi:CRISPR system Cascade subunit CasA